MELIFQVCGAMLLVSAALVALTLATVFAYAAVVLIKASTEDRKKKAKRSKKGTK